MVALLNAYFERMAGAVMNRGGEVLRFIGDGLLAVFPLTAFKSHQEAAVAALAAAEKALVAIEQLNAEPPRELAPIDGWRSLGTAVTLHEGDPSLLSGPAMEVSCAAIVAKTPLATA